MGNKVPDILKEMQGKNIGVLGLGRSNIALIRFLSRWDLDITACDRKSAEELGATFTELNRLGVKFTLGPNYMNSLDDFHIIFKTPGIPNHLPSLVDARSRGTLITSEMGLLMKLCPVPVVGITGSDGKTTTTTLVGKFLKEAGIKTLVGGNIGTPLIEGVLDLEEGSVVVLEMSSFQLEVMEKSPHVGVVLNITPNHLDVHRDMREYVEAKKHIYQYQVAGDFSVFNQENHITKSMADEAPQESLLFSKSTEVSQGTFLRDGMIIARFKGQERAICHIRDIRLRGIHNIENVLAATCAVLPFGINSETILKVVSTFRGVEHRLEPVREINGVRYFNDSIASSPTRTISGLNSFQEPIILIAGGYDKNLSFTELAEVILNKVKSLILIGDTAHKIQQVVEEAMERKEKDIPIIRSSNLKDAVDAATDQAHAGDVVLLSPACASFDMFKDFEERGQRFKELVMAIK